MKPTILLLVLSITLTGCGQKGDLFLPEQNLKAQTGSNPSPEAEKP
jgi:predicted small lipoprotein YifL